jgi:tol-pal system protein YbgF
MFKRYFLRISLFLAIPLLFGGPQKEKRAYELIYQDVQTLKQQMLEFDAKLETYQEEIQTIKKQVMDLLSLLRSLQAQQASFQEDQKKVPDQFQILLERLDALGLQFSRFSEELIEIKKAMLPLLPQEEQEENPEETQEEAQQTPPEKEAVEKAGAEEKKEETKSPLPPNLSPQEIYNMAYADYLKGNFDLAIDGFKIYLDNFSQSPFADNALYWIGECYFSEKKYEEAIARYNELILNYPLGDKVPAAYLHKGLSLIELGQNEEALSVFRLLVSKYPLEEETKIAQEKIKELIKQNERY